MKNARAFLLDWWAHGDIDDRHFKAALRVGGVVPSDARWRCLLDRLLLALGVVFLLSGIVTFFAANWQDMGRFGRFLLVDALLILTFVVTWRLKLSSVGGRAALFGAAVLVGVLLAIVGQTYQTGADTFELFAAWALLILPWTLLARFSTLWLLWIGLTNLAIALYFDAYGGLPGFVSGDRAMYLVFVGINAALLLLFEGLSNRRGHLPEDRWIPRSLAVLAGTAITMLALAAILDSDGNRLLDLSVWLTGTAALFWYYRWQTLDLFMLSGTLLSVIIIVVAGLIRLLMGNGGGAPMLLIIALAVVGMSAFAGWWLTHLVRHRAP